MNDEASAARIQDICREDHHRIDALGERLLNPVHVNDAAAADEAFAEFERVVLAHLDVEEKHMLPLLEHDNADEVAAIRAEHDKIRKLLAEIGVGIELHAVREDLLEQIGAFLKAHAHREEALLYSVAESRAEPGLWASILDRLHLSRASRPHRDAAE